MLTETAFSFFHIANGNELSFMTKKMTEYITSMVPKYSFADTADRNVCVAFGAIHFQAHIILLYCSN